MNKISYKISSIALIFVAIAILTPFDVFSQSDGGRKKKNPVKTEQTQISKPKQKQNAEAKRKQEENARQQQEAEAKRKQDEETHLQQEAEAKCSQEEETRQPQEVEMNRTLEEELRQMQEVRVRKRHNTEYKQETTGFHNGYEYVDLGLPSGLKWATCNVGAISPSDYGSYFAWGEIIPKSNYTEKNYKTAKKTTNDISGNPKYDASRVKWGGKWRLPTKKECQELISICKWTKTVLNNKNGYKVEGPNGNSIFLPAAGFRFGSGPENVGSSGYYWSSTPDESSLRGAYSFWFIDGPHSIDKYSRYYGRSIRPVTK